MIKSNIKVINFNKLYSRENFNFLLVIYISSQIIFPLSSNIYISNMINILLLIFFSIYFVLTKKTKLHINYMTKAYLFVAIVSFSSALWSIEFSHSLTMSKSVFLNAINLVLILNIIKIFKINNSILYGILVGVFFNYFIALGLMEWTTEWTNPVRFVGTLARSTATATAMISGIFVSMLLWHKKKTRLWRLLLVINFILASYTILLTVSKKGILIGGLLILLFSLLRMRKKKSFINIILLGSILFFTSFSFIEIEIIKEKISSVEERFYEFNSGIEDVDQGGSTGDRLVFLQRGINIFLENPLLGTGLNTYILQDPTQHYSHNNYIELLVGLGLFGFIPYFFIYIITIRKASKLHSKEKKYIVFMIILALLIMDFMQASYLNKILLFMLLYMSIDLELEKVKNKILE